MTTTDTRTPTRPAPEPDGPAPTGASRALSHADYARLAALSAQEIAQDCEVDVFHATGPGGQCVNTTDSAVRMTHVPTGIVVTCRESRSQFRNRQLCLQKLRDEFARRAVPPKARHATKPTRASKQRKLEAKHRRSATKQLRRRPQEEE